MYFMAQHEDTPNGSKSWRKLCIKQQQWDILPKKYVSIKITFDYQWWGNLRSQIQVLFSVWIALAINLPFNPLRPDPWTTCSRVYRVNWFWAYAGQPHNHIDWAMSMLFTSINSTNSRTNPKKFHKKILRIGGAGKGWTTCSPLRSLR